MRMVDLIQKKGMEIILQQKRFSLLLKVILREISPIIKCLL